MEIAFKFQKTQHLKKFRKIRKIILIIKFKSRIVFHLTNKTQIQMMILHNLKTKRCNLKIKIMEKWNNVYKIKRKIIMEFKKCAILFLINIV